MTFDVRCRHCPRDRALVIAVPRIEDRQEGILRTHLHAAHPQVPEAQTLGELLSHFTVEQVPAR